MLLALTFTFALTVTVPYNTLWLLYGILSKRYLRQISCLFVSRVSFRYFLMNVSVFAVFPEAVISFGKFLTRRAVQRPGL